MIVVGVFIIILCLLRLPCQSLSLSLSLSLPLPTSLYILSRSPSLFSLQGTSLFYEFKTYSNDSEIFSGIEIDNVNEIGVFANASMFSQHKSILQALTPQNNNIMLIDWLTLCTTRCLHFEFMDPIGYIRSTFMAYKKVPSEWEIESGYHHIVEYWISNNSLSTVLQ
jgi:hypothetical protein